MLRQSQESGSSARLERRAQGGGASAPRHSPQLAPCGCAQISRVDAEILAAVRQQSTSGSRARQDLTNAKLTIDALFGKIRDIQRKAEQSELMVQEICRDIKKLDYAKKHLTSTITALRRLAMLVTAIGGWAGAGQAKAGWGGPGQVLQVSTAWQRCGPGGCCRRRCSCCAQRCCATRSS